MSHTHTYTVHLLGLRRRQSRGTSDDDLSIERAIRSSHHYNLDHVYIYQKHRQSCIIQPHLRSCRGSDSLSKERQPHLPAGAAACKTHARDTSGRPAAAAPNSCAVRPRPMAAAAWGRQLPPGCGYGPNALQAAARKRTSSPPEEPRPPQTPCHARRRLQAWRTACCMRSLSTEK